MYLEILQRVCFVLNGFLWIVFGLWAAVMNMSIRL